MADWNALAEGFRYDLWANRLWLDCLRRKGFPEPDTAIFRHIFSAQAVWVSRLEGVSPDRMLEVELTDEATHDVHARWLTALANLDEDRVVHYRRTNGDPQNLPLSQIALHAINHGTYHRGELRGLCLARGDVDFPETDRVLFWFEMFAPGAS
jgi:uncharacterized damage-inducible protein DinB